MKIYNVSFTEKDIHNARELLGRVSLTGKEVPAFVSISNALANAKPIEPKNQVKPEETQNEPTP